MTESLIKADPCLGQNPTRLHLLPRNTPPALSSIRDSATLTTLAPYHGPTPTFLGENTPKVPPSSLMATPISASKASLEDRAAVRASSEASRTSLTPPDPPTNQELSVGSEQHPLVELH